MVLTITRTCRTEFGKLTFTAGRRHACSVKGFVIWGRDWQRVNRVVGQEPSWAVGSCSNVDDLIEPGR